jgi:CBS domain containing-hemolysin-like protein
VEGPMHAVRLPEGAIHPVAFAISISLVIYLHVVIGEMVPKNLALAGPDRAALILAPPLVAIARAIRPVIVALNAVANGVLRLLRVEPKTELASTYTADEVQSIVEESAREGLLVDEHGLLTGALEFSERMAGDLMVPISRLETVQIGSTPGEVETLVTRTGFSRFPVMRGDDAIGYLHLKDLLYADDDRHEQPIPEKRIRTMVSVATVDEVEEALAAMQRAGTHLARVVADGGRTVGVLFLEDVIEELVGEVRDATRRDQVSRP